MGEYEMEYGVKYFAASSMTGDNVTEVFDHIF